MTESIAQDLANAHQAAERLLVAWGQRPGGESSPADLREFAQLAGIVGALRRLAIASQTVSPKVPRLLRPLHRWADRRRLKRVRAYWETFGVAS